MDSLNSIRRSQFWLAIALVANIWFLSVFIDSFAISSESHSSSAGDPVEIGSQETYNGIPAGFTAENYPYLGDPNAPVKIVEYSDYLCPFSGRYYTETFPVLLEKYVRTGKVMYVYRDFPIASLHPTASIGSTTATCAGEQGAGIFWTVHDKLYINRNEWANLQDPATFLADMAKTIGADTWFYDKCITSGWGKSMVEKSVAEAKALGFNGTPSFQFVNNKDGKEYKLVGAHPVEVFTQWIDALYAGEEPPGENEEKEPEKRELPFWSNPETGLAPDPDRSGFTLAGAPYKGDPKAPLVVIEFSDFQCDFCQTHALETQPVLDEKFVDTGEIMWVYKHFPLKIHPQSPVAAAAAECAADQGKFWEMYKLLFEEMDRWSNGDTDAELTLLAEKLKLDMKQFTQCFNGRNVLQRVLEDIYDGQSLAQGTPTFIVVYGGEGGVLRGARSADQFVSLLEAHIKRASEAQKKQVNSNQVTGNE